uniref:Secreted protein n=1 Tax=Lotus japonicus TaxID=34305 RepID=I3SSU4_LOTJA|nr:unknown [Lotus japonicus]
MPLIFIIFCMLLNRHINSLIPYICRVVREFSQRLFFMLMEENDPHEQHHKRDQSNTHSPKYHPSKNSQRTKLPLLRESSRIRRLRMQRFRNLPHANLP